MSNYIFYNKIFDDNDLSKIRLLINSNEWVKNSNYAYGKRDVIFTGENHMKMLKESMPPFAKVRDSYNGFLDEHLKKSLNSYTQNKFLIDVKLARYNIDDEYIWHSDQYFDEKNIELQRILTTITYLNDDFEGGETEFKDMIIKPKNGYTLIFPSEWFVVHRGKPVLKGTKYILVAHMFSKVLN
jgi:hypothetical protein